MMLALDFWYNLELLVLLTYPVIFNIYKFVCINTTICVQMLIYKGLCDVTIGKKTTSLILLDDCGNIWNCITIFGTRPHHHIKLGGGWKRMVDARRLEEGVLVKVGF